MSIDPNQLINDYVNEIIRRSRGVPRNKLSEFRDVIKQRLATFDWLLTRMDAHVFNVIMQTGDMFLKDEPEVALDLFREASLLCPNAAICYARQALCQVELVYFDQAKKSCRKAIRLSGVNGVDMFEELFSLIGQFVKHRRLREAHDLYVCLIDHFPNHAGIGKYSVVKKIEELKTLLINKAEEDKKNISKYETKEKPSGGSSSEMKKIGANIDQSSSKAKTSKQLKREQMAKDKLLQSEIQKAAKEQEDKLKKQEELKECKRQEREEKEEHLRKQLEMETRRRRDEEQYKKELEKQKNKETNERAGTRSSRKPNVRKDINAPSTRTKNSSRDIVLPGKGESSLDDMSKVLDHPLSTGSILRCVCPKCENPRVVSKRNCHSCGSELVIWYREFGTSSWIQPRKAPKDVSGPYKQCKHFRQDKHCVKTLCTFAHGQDELEIWKLCREKSNEVLAEHKTRSLSQSQPWSSINLDSTDSGLSSQSSTQSFSGTYEMRSSGDISDEFKLKSGCSPSHSQDRFDELSQDSGFRFKSSFLSSDDEINSYLTDDYSTQSSQSSIVSSTVETNESDDGWTTVGSTKGNLGINKKQSTATFDSTTTSHQDFVSVVMNEEKSRCNFCDIKFSSPLQLEYHYSHVQHKVNIMKRSQEIAKSLTKCRPPPDGVYMGRYKLCRRFKEGYCYFGAKCTFAHGDDELNGWRKLYESQVENLEKLEKKQLLSKSFREKVRQRIQDEGQDVLKVDLPGVTVNCSSPWRVELDVPQDHVWTIDVRIQTKYQQLCSQVAFLLETHLDKFTFLSRTEGNCSLNVQSIRLHEEDFVEDIDRQESAVQFRIQFSSKVLGDFRQTLLFDFGNGLVLARSLNVLIVSRDMYNSKEVSSSRTSYCNILEWSEEEMELVKCKDLVEMNLDGLCDQYSIPDALPDLSGCTEFTRETYCKLWHDILFIEEKHIQREVKRYDILDGEMKILNSFPNANETVFAQKGEFFGQIYLSDYLVMDEVAGNLISRSVMSVILHPKLEQTQSNRVYECSIKTKTSELVIIKLNAVLCQEYVFEKDQVICIDLKFRYNRLPMCEMHQTIDRSQHKIEILLPNVKNVSYKHKKSISDWYLDKKPNKNQHEAIAMILDPSPTPPILVIGPFGTGKTYAISLACVSILTQSDRNKVLICTHSNSAADIHLQHLDEKIQDKPSLHIRPLRVLYRFLKIQRFPEKLRKYCLIEETTNAVREPTWEEIRDHNVIITTLVTARILWEFCQDGRLRFSHILIDEAAQAQEPECVTPLVMADENTKIVLAGDHKQMGATAYSKCLWPDDFGPRRSLLERLFNHYKQSIKTLSQPGPSSDDNTASLRTPYVVLLTENYRCHAKILEFPSDCFYGGKLLARGDQRTHDLIPVLSFYTAQGVDQRVEEGLAYYNLAEVAEVVKQVEELTDIWPKDWGEMNIGVVTLYHDQVKRIRDGLRKKGLGYVAVETVENVQGKEFKALFISTVRTMWTYLPIEDRNVESNSDLSELNCGFLSDPRLLNTAVTRAQSLLAVVGDPMSLCSVGACRNLWKDYLRRCDANKGLYGCTLKTVMDFCLNSQALDPTAQEFIPGESVQVKKDENAASENQNNDQDGLETSQSAIDAFFSRDDTENVGKIIKELIKACEETMKDDVGSQQETTDEDFPLLNDNAPTTSTTPNWPNISSKQTFFAGWKDGRIELGFHVKDSDRLFRLTGGKLLKEKGDNQPGHDVEASPQELKKLLEENPARFTKCSFRVDTSVHPQGYFGRVPAPDSPDIKIPGRVRGVYEDDVVVLELQPSAKAHDEKELREGTVVIGYIKGVLQRPIEPRERQFVCTVDRANLSTMIPINKKLPKLTNFTKTDEDIIPIYTLKNGDVKRAKILSEKHHGEALAGERVFVVKYFKWRPDCPHPLGLAVRHIPHGRDFETGMEILYEEHNVRRKFDQELRTSVTRKFSENWQVPKSEKGRPVYRKNVFTIDRPELLDLDDAISVRSLDNGNFNLQIHIADVSYFVQPNTKLDEEARLRGTSYYPPKPEKTVPMLPRELSEGCCSLLQGEDRLAVTVSFELKPDGTDVGDVKVERSVVRLNFRLTYLEAQQIIDERSQQDLPVNQEEKQVPVKEAIRIIHRIAQGRRRLRLGVERSLYSIERDDCDEGDGNEQDAHQMIQEIMIMTNHFVAKYLLEKFPKRTPLRVQPPPKNSDLKEWRKCFDTILNFSLELNMLEDAENARKKTMELKVPFETWTVIMNHVKNDANFRELVKLVCDLDLFPQLALANLKRQLIQQRSQYICSGEMFEKISFPWPQQEKRAPTNQQIARANDSLDVLDVNVSLSEDNTNLPKASEDSIGEETISGNANTVEATDNACSSFNEGNQYSVDVSNQRDSHKIFYGHSSLCLDAYCHFTSPIRRYIDIIVHRLVVSGIENKNSAMEPEDITTICDRCTFLTRNSRDFDKDTKKLRLAEDLQGSFRFVSAFIEEIELHALKLFFGTGEFEILNSKSVRIARLGPEKDPQEADGEISLQWTFRVLLLNQLGRTQSSLSISDTKNLKNLAKKLKNQAEDEILSNTSEAADDNFDYVVTGEQWNMVLDAIKNQNEDQLKSQLQNVDDVFQKQKRPTSSTELSLSTNESTKDETDVFLEVVRSFKPFGRVKVQICSEMNRGLLTPAIQLFKLTDKIHVCVEHRSFPTTCFAKTSHKRPTSTQVSDITEYVDLWKPVLMMEIATSAVRDDDVVILSNLFVRFARDAKGFVTIQFHLSNKYCVGHFLDPLDLNLMCVRIKDPDGTGKDTGYWVGHFQISEVLRMGEEAEETSSAEEDDEEEDVPHSETELDSSFTTKRKENTQKEQNACPTVFTFNISDPIPWLEDENLENKSKYQLVLARLIQSCRPVPESLITQEFCCASVELISLSIPERRRLEALVDSVKAPKLVQDICTGKVSTEHDVEESVPPDILSACDHSLPNFSFSLNFYQQQAVQKALTKSFTLIQGPPGTGKTVTGVHIAHWFAQLNRRRKLAEKKEGEKHSGSMVFYCGPSNKSVDVVARYLMKNSDAKILRVYGQEIEQKMFPVPEKVTQSRSKRVAVQLKADEDLKDVSLHYVIRSAESPFAKVLVEYDMKFKKYIERKKSAPRGIIEAFKQYKSGAEKWAITRRGVNVILATCTTAYSPRILRPCKDFISQCIIDECGMCIEAETLCAMVGKNAKQVVLIGDHKQLQPVIQCDKAKDLGLGISMFERFSKQAHMLKIQYRMHENLCQFPSHFFYDDKLETAKEVKERKPDKVTWPNGNSYPFEFHHVEGIEESLVVSTEKGNENSKKNQKEVDKVVDVARRLTNEGIKREDIVVLSPYRAQCSEITEKLKQHTLKGIAVMSVVAAQGSEKNYVILSLVRSLPEHEIERNPSRSWLMEKLGFITDEHQINVALTRAKRGLCIIGNANLIRACSMWKELLKHYEKNGCLLKYHLSFTSPVFQGFSEKKRNGTLAPAVFFVTSCLDKG